MTVDVKDVQWEKHPVLYCTLTIDPAHIPSREAFLERLDIELERLRADAVSSWDATHTDDQGDKHD